MSHRSLNDVLHRLADLLATYRSLLATHPNDGDLSVFAENWAASSEELTQYYTTGFGGDDLPEDLKKLIDDIRDLQMSRKPITLPNLLPLPTKQGMSPKKFHEVQRMATYVKNLVDSVYEKNPSHAQGRLHIVDVGAGQGYLTRALGHLFPDARLLALDADHGQTLGAERRGKDRRIDPVTSELNGRIDHKTVLITPNSLLETVDDWINEEKTGNPPVPVLFVALHACGSLTPDILRAFLSCISKPYSEKTNWRAFSLVAVGCCYNLMYPEDYPLSSTLRSYPAATQNPLTTSSFHLAAQTPLAWLQQDPKSSEWTMQPLVKLATQKVAWRALLQFALADSRIINLNPSPPSAIKGNDLELEKKVKLSSDVPVKWWKQPQSGSSRHIRSAAPPPLHPSLNPSSESSNPPSNFDRRHKVKASYPPLDVKLEGIGITEVALRLGKLPDSAYQQGWPHFLNVAGKKLGVRWEVEDLNSLRDSILEKRIGVLHTLRCFLGSAVESAILLDRLEWIQEEIERVNLRTQPGGAGPPPRFAENWNAGFVNLFDQAVGSGRNVSLVISPAIPLYT